MTVARREPRRGKEKEMVKQATDRHNGNGEDSQARWRGIRRPYSQADVRRLRGRLQIEHTLARVGSERLWHLLQAEPYLPTLGALTGNQAIQQVQAGLRAIYASGWQVAADANNAGEMYPDQSLYPVDSGPDLVRRINRALLRADQIDCAAGENDTHWLAPIIADAEAGFGGPLNAFELMKAMIEAGAAGVHFEDQLASAKKCGHLGGKVLVPTEEFIQKLIAARLAADVLGVPTVLLARTDANAAKLITSDHDPQDRGFLTGERTPEGHFGFRGGLEAAIARGLAYAPYADLIWCETSSPDLAEARRFADAIHAEFPEKLLAYNCSPSFNWRQRLDDRTIAIFQQELGVDGLQVPVRHAGRLPCAERQHVRAGAGVPGNRHDGLRPPPGGRIPNGTGGGLPGGQTPAVRWDRLLRRGGGGDRRSSHDHPRAGRLYRSGAVRHGRSPGRLTEPQPGGTRQTAQCQLRQALLWRGSDGGPPRQRQFSVRSGGPRAG